MPSVQTTYSDNIPAGAIGAQATELPAKFISRNVEPSAGIAFGLAVIQGTEDKQCDAFAGTGPIIGITSRVRSVGAESPNSYAQYDSARIQTEGDIWVQASVAVDAGDNVYVTNAGAWTNSAGGNTQLAGARWETSTTGAGLAVIRW